MVRHLLTVVACSLAVALLSTATGGIDTPAASAAATPIAHSARVMLSRDTATRQMRAFLRSAVQVTAVDAPFAISGCRRLSRRAIDCTARIRGRSRVTMRARLLGKRNTRVQLYVIGVRAA